MVGCVTNQIRSSRHFRFARATLPFIFASLGWLLIPTSLALFGKDPKPVTIEYNDMQHTQAKNIARQVVAGGLWTRPEYGGLAVLQQAVGRKEIQQMRQDAERCYHGVWLGPHGQEGQGRTDASCFVKYVEAEQNGLEGLTNRITLLQALCAQLSIARPRGERPLEPGGVQLACYDGNNAQYGVHRDGYPTAQLASDLPSCSIAEIDARRISIVLYLQLGAWQPSWGGFFRAHRSAIDLGEAPTSHVDVFPRGGTMVIFRSRDLPHEVLPTSRQRFALSMWCLQKGWQTRSA